MFTRESRKHALQLFLMLFGVVLLMVGFLTYVQTENILFLVGVVAACLVIISLAMDFIKGGSPRDG